MGLHTLLAPEDAGGCFAAARQEGTMSELTTELKNVKNRDGTVEVTTLQGGTVKGKVATASDDFMVVLEENGKHRFLIPLSAIAYVKT
jgi:hypothetical protein